MRRTDDLAGFKMAVLALLGGLILWAVAFKVAGADGIGPYYGIPPGFDHGAAGIVTLPSLGPANIWISCGDHGSVSISTKDGSVKLDNCEPDEGSRAFWAAVTRMFPGAR
jgi:hypothetical protein